VHRERTAAESDTYADPGARGEDFETPGTSRAPREAAAGTGAEKEVGGGRTDDRAQG